MQQQVAERSGRCTVDLRVDAQAPPPLPVSENGTQFLAFGLVERLEAIRERTSLLKL